MADPDPGFWAGKAVVVTGGAGFLGSRVVEMLDELGALVGVIRSREHDLRDPAASRDAVRGGEVDDDLRVLDRRARRVGLAQVVLARADHPYLGA